MGSLDFSTKKHCYKCGSTKTGKNGKGSENWFNKPYGKDKQICNNCYNKLFSAPNYAKRHPELIRARNLRYNRLKVTFRGVDVLVTFRQLSGYCSKCTRNIYDGTCKITQMHHRFYIIIIPWFGREELCVSCHNKTKERDAYGRILKETI